MEVLRVTFLVPAWKASSHDRSPSLSPPSVVEADLGKKVPPGELSESLTEWERNQGRNPGKQLGVAVFQWGRE